MEEGEGPGLRVEGVARWTVDSNFDSEEAEGWEGRHGVELKLGMVQEGEEGES